MVSNRMHSIARPYVWLLSAVTSLAVLLASCGTAPPTDAPSDDASSTNAPPAIEPIADQRTTLNEPIDVRIAIDDEDPDTVFLATTVDDPSLVPDGSLRLLGAGADRTLRVTPAADATGATTVVVAARDDVGNDATTSFELSVDPPFRAAPSRLSIDDGSAGDWFGISVAIDGDSAVVGAYYDDHDRGSDAGSAYVFQRVGGAWSELQKLTASDGAAGDQFGISVAIDGDHAIVGAYLDGNDNGSNAGAAYVFQRIDGTWTEVQKLTASDGAATDWFGTSVAIDGDHAIVGAFLGDTGNGRDAGAAYVYQRIEGTWAEVQKLTASDGAASDQFGRSVAIDGDYAIVGASGGAYVFQHVDGTWTEAPKLTAADGTVEDGFGASVAIAGAYAIVGANGDDNDRGSRAGAAYAFQRVGTTWTQLQKLTATDGTAGDRFGYSVAMDGDYAIIGAWWDDDLEFQAGSAYLYQQAGGAWSEVAKLVAGDGAEGDRFGGSVAIGGADVLVGADRKDALTGAAYAVER